MLEGFFVALLFLYNEYKLCFYSDSSVLVVFFSYPKAFGLVPIDKQ